LNEQGQTGTSNLAGESWHQVSMNAMKVRLWVEMLAIVSLIACAAALVIATVGSTADAAAGEPETALAAEPRQSSASPTQSSSPEASPVQPQNVQPQNYDGVITDTRCGAKHSAAIGQSAADCTRACVHGGERFALVDGDKMYALEGEVAGLKHSAGERVRIVGRLNGNTISVASVRAPAP
jgi:hypothetical protein